MKTHIRIASLLVLFLSIALPTRADIEPKLGAFFSKRIEATTISAIIDAGSSGPDSMRKDAKAVLLALAPAWAEELRALTGFAEDTPKDKAIVLQLRATSNALLAAKQDRTRADEAFRSLIALRRYAPPKAKVGDGN